MLLLVKSFWNLDFWARGTDELMQGIPRPLSCTLACKYATGVSFGSLSHLRTLDLINVSILFIVFLCAFPNTS